MPNEEVPAQPPGRRAHCTRCGRPQRACICHWFRPVANEVHLLILQHPDEVHQPKGSAGLLAGSLHSCEVWVGERCDDGRLARWLAAGDAALLYPPTEGAALVQTPAQVRRLVVLDATWRKSLRMLRGSPLLQTLPRVSLKEVPASRYRIRKARLAHQLSTLEACCQALGELEGQPTRYEALLAAFDGFVAEQACWMAGLPPSQPSVS